MSKATRADKDIAEEYDFSGGERGRYAVRFREGTNLVAIDPDLLEVFPDSEAVNRALRSLAGKLETQAKASNNKG